MTTMSTTSSSNGRQAPPAPEEKGPGLAGKVAGAAGAGIGAGTVLMFVLGQLFSTSGNVGELKAGLQAEHEQRRHLERTLTGRLDKLEVHVGAGFERIEELLRPLAKK